MPGNNVPTFGMLPEPEGRTASFVTSSAINLCALALVLFIGMTAKRVIEQHYETTELVLPTEPPPPPIKMKLPKLPPPPPQPPKVQMEAPKIETPKLAPTPKPVQMEAKAALPEMKQAARPQVVLRLQPRAALRAAMPAQSPQVRPSTAPVHFGDTFGVRPNPNATRPATVAAIGNPYGGMNGPAVAPHGVVGSTGIGNGTRYGSNAGTVGRVASAGIPGATGNGNGNGNGGGGNYGRGVGSAGIPGVAAVPVVRQQQAQVASTDLEVISKPPVRYTTEARQLRVEGNVVLRVTFLASGQVVVHGVVHGLGHGLDEEAWRVAQQIRFRPATRNGQPVDLTTNVTITFQLA